MKTSARLLSVAIAAASLCGSAALFTGCAGTATRASTGEMIDDSVVTAKVRTELIRDEVVNGREINIDTFRGTVQLSGFVETPEQKARAGDIAARVTGVNNVVNNIAIKTPQPPR